MPVIKSILAPTNLVPFSMKDIEAQARAILSRAQQQAEQLITAAQISASELKDKAAIEGMIEGRKEGIAKGGDEGRKAGLQQALNENKQKLTQLMGSLTKGADELNASRKKLEAEAMTEVVKLAVSIARRVTKCYGELNPNVLTANVSEAMKLVIHSTDVRIAIHPSQRDTLSSVLPQLKMQWPSLEHVNLIEDASIAAGGCRVWAGQGEVNADLDTQIDKIAAELVPVPPPAATPTAQLQAEAT